MPAAYETADEDGDFGPISNPLPPPPRPGDKPPAEEEKPLSNEDFRRMVAETPRRGEDKQGKNRNQRKVSGDGEKPKKKWQPKPKEGEETGAGTGTAYRDRAKERREDQNPDYDGASAELGGLHAVPAPGTFSDIHTSDAHKISIENSKYLGGDVEHTHLVKGLDYALLQKVRSELKKSLEETETEDGDDAKARAKERRRKEAEEKAMSIRTGVAKSVYQWLVKPTRSSVRASEMFLPGRTSFVFELEDEFAADIPTTLHRSKADCPAPQDLLDASVDALLLDRISRVMSYLRLGSSAKGLKKLKKRDRDLVRPNGVAELRATARDSEEPSPRPETANGAKPPKPSLADDDDIFEGAGREYTLEVPEKSGKENRGGRNENDDRSSYFAEPGKAAPQPEEALLPPPPPPPDAGAAPPQYGNDYGPQAPQGGYDGMAYPEVAPEYYQGYPPAEMYPQAADYQYGPAPGAVYPPQGVGYGYEAYPEAPPPAGEDFGPQPLTQADKDKGAASVFRRDDASLRQRDRDDREKDPGFVSDTYAECYPGYGEYNHEVLEGSDEEEDKSKMDLGAKGEKRLQRYDFETQEEYDRYHLEREAMPKAAFQFGVKTADGRKTRKTQSKEQKLNNELHRIEKMISAKKDARSRGEDGGDFVRYGEDEEGPGKKQRTGY